MNFENILTKLKRIRSGIATTGVSGAGLGIGIVVFAVFIAAVEKNPEIEKTLFPYTILGFTFVLSFIITVNLANTIVFSNLNVIMGSFLIVLYLWTFDKINRGLVLTITVALIFEVVIVLLNKIIKNLEYKFEQYSNFKISFNYLKNKIYGRLF